MPTYFYILIGITLCYLYVIMAQYFSFKKVKTDNYLVQLYSGDFGSNHSGNFVWSGDLLLRA